jgi:hypothetical protein
MKADNDGFPVVGDESGSQLGVRLDMDIDADDEGYVWPRSGGVSVSPGNPVSLPRHRRPPEYSGTGRDPVWSIGATALPDGLVYRDDPDKPDRHGFIEPSTRMELDEYRLLIRETRQSWVRLKRDTP